MDNPVTDIEVYHRCDEMMRIFRDAVRKAQAESRRLGVANVYGRNGEIFYELPNGELTKTDPSKRVTELPNAGDATGTASEAPP